MNRTNCSTSPLLLLALLLTACTTPAQRDAEMEQAASARSPLTGHPAPAFTLQNDLGQPVSLADYQGQWLVVYFYPQDDTPACTCQATEFTDLLGRFKAFNTAVIGISPDTPDTHRRFRQKYSLTLTLLSDHDHQATRQYGAWHQMGWQDQTIGRVIRSTFLINPQGRIAHHWPEVIPQGHAARVHQKLESLRATSP